MQTKSEIFPEIQNPKIPLERTIALVPWGDVWDDYLDSIDVSLETFCTEGPGGWMLGFIDALRLAGVRTVLILVSARVRKPLRFIHEASGSTISVLPAPKIYRTIHPLLKNPYSASGQKVASNVSLAKRLLAKLLYDFAAYLSTPMGLLVSELKREGCSAILCQEYEYTRFDACVVLGKLLGIPVFANFQGGSFDENSIGRFFRPLTIKACSGLAIGSQTEIQRVSSSYKIQPAKIAQIFNPIDLGAWNTIDREQARATLAIPPNARVVVWHGRVELHTKRLDILLDAWEKICSQRPGQDLRLLLMGTGQDAEKVRQRIAALPIQNVLWVDKYVTDRAEIRHFLVAGDVYAFPSSHEGFPVAPIEAMGCGLPVVATAASGVSDIFKDGEASGGLVVPCGDLEAFFLALSRVLDDPAWGQELGQRARSRVEKYFSLEVVGRQLRDFLLENQNFGRVVS